MKRIIAVLLLLCTVLSVMVSCKKKQEESTETSNTISTTEGISDGLPDVNMNGFELNILGYTTENMSWAEVTLAPTEETGNVLYDEMFKRNLALEERFGFFFKVDTPDQTINASAIETMVLGGDTSYDIVMYYDKNTMASAQYFRDWKTCEYIDLSQDYWNPNITKNFEYNDKQFAISGNFSLSMLSRTDALLFNKEMFANYNNGDISVLYNLVKEKKWTLEEMYKYAAAVVDDDNGTAGDSGQYGITASKKEYYLGLMVASDVTITRTAKDGTIVFTLPTDTTSRDKIEQIMEYNQGNNIHYDSHDSIHYNAPERMFEDGQSLFSIKSIYFIPDVRGNMNKEFGIVPMPMYDIEQGKYISATAGGDVACLLNTVPDSDLENIGIIMEAWAFHSQHNLVPVYQEKLIKTRYSSDLDSYEMLTLIFDTAYAYGGLGSININPIMEQLVTDYFLKEGETGLASLLQKMNPTVKAEINKITVGTK